MSGLSAGVENGLFAEASLYVLDGYWRKMLRDMGRGVLPQGCRLENGILYISPHLSTSDGKGTRDDDEKEMDVVAVPIPAKPQDIMLTVTNAFRKHLQLASPHEKTDAFVKLDAERRVKYTVVNNDKKWYTKRTLKMQLLVAFAIEKANEFNGDLEDTSRILTCIGYLVGSKHLELKTLEHTDGKILGLDKYLWFDSGKKDGERLNFGYYGAGGSLVGWKE